MSKIVTTDYAIDKIAAPSLPLAPREWDQRYQDQFANVLRLYFNRLDDFIARLQTTSGAVDGSGIQFPNGAFYQDGYTTLTTGISNTSTADIVVASTADFVLSTGGLLIGTEIIGYTGKTSATFTGITRGMYGSTKAAHLAGAVVTEAQTLSSPTVALPVALLKTTVSSGVALDTADKTKLVFATPGIYNIQFSVQMVNYDTVIDNVTLWFRLDGTDIPYSAGVATVPAVHGGVAGTNIISWNLVQPVTANQYIQLLFASDTGNTVCATYPSGTAPVHPVSPSVIITATFVSALPT